MNTIKSLEFYRKEPSSKYEVSKLWFSISIKCNIAVMFSKFTRESSSDHHIIYRIQ